MQIKKTIIDMAVGFVLSLMVVVPLSYTTGLFDPKPYTGVDLLKMERNGNIVYVDVSFIKNDDCSFIKLGAFTGTLGAFTATTWADRDEPQGDRLAGHHVLRLKVLVDPGADTLEIRTRHLCPAGKVDRVLVSVPL